MTASRSRKINAPAVARAAVLAVWAAFFAYLWWSDDVTRYLGPRTHWVVVFGTITLTAAALAHLKSFRKASAKQLTVGQALGHAVTVVPIAVALMAPGADLGALAVSRKLVGSELSRTRIVAPPVDEDRPVSFIDMFFASRSADYARAAGVRAGEPIELVGFVTHDKDSDDFRLTRFYISCCAADAVPYWADVVAEEDVDYPDDTWLRVEGTIEEGERGFVLEASDIEEVDEPDPPYLY